MVGRNMYAHVTTNITPTEIDVDTIHGHSKFLGFPNDGMPVTGDYHDVIVRTVDGWRSRHRRAEIRQRNSSTDSDAVLRRPRGSTARPGACAARGAVGGTAP